MVAGKGIFDVVLVHHQKADAIGQWPGFIRALAEEQHTVMEEFIGSWNNDCVWIRFNRLNQIDEASAIRGRRHRVANFGEHPACCDECALSMRRNGQGALVCRVVRIEERKVVKRVGERLVH